MANSKSAWVINAKGQVVGTSERADRATERPLPKHLFLWQPDKGMQDLGELPPEVRPYSINNLGRLWAAVHGEILAATRPFFIAMGR